MPWKIQNLHQLNHPHVHRVIHIIQALKLLIQLILLQEMKMLILILILMVAVINMDMIWVTWQEKVIWNIILIYLIPPTIQWLIAKNIAEDMTQDIKMVSKQRGDRLTT